MATLTREFNESNYLKPSSTNNNSRNSNQSLDELWNESNYSNNLLKDEILNEEINLPLNFSDELEDLINMPLVQGPAIKTYLPSSPPSSPKISTRRSSNNNKNNNLENNNNVLKTTTSKNNEEELNNEALKRSRRISMSLIPVRSSSRLSFHEDNYNNTSPINSQLESIAVTNLLNSSRSSSPIDSRRNNNSTRPKLVRGNSTNSSLRDIELLEETLDTTPRGEGKLRSTVRSVSESTTFNSSDPVEWASFKRPSRDIESISSIPRIRPISISLSSSYSNNSINLSSPVDSTSISTTTTSSLYGSPRLPTSTSNRKLSLAESFIQPPKIRNGSISNSPQLTKVTSTSPRIRAQTSNMKSTDLPIPLRSVSTSASQTSSLRSPSTSTVTNTNTRPTSIYSSSNSNTNRPSSIYLPSSSSSRPTSIYSPTFSKPLSSLITSQSTSAIHSPSSSSSSTSPTTSPTIIQTPRYSPILNKSRQRSFSTGRMLDDWNNDNRNDEPIAPWVQDTPLIFRSDENGQLGRTGRMDQVVLPAVAKRIEAERLSNLNLVEDDILITSWEKDGTPRSTILNIQQIQQRVESPPTSPVIIHQLGKEDEEEEEEEELSSTVLSTTISSQSKSQINLTPPSTPISGNSSSTSTTNYNNKESEISNSSIPRRSSSNTTRKFSTTPEIRIERSSSIDTTSTSISNIPITIQETTTNLLPSFIPKSISNNSISSVSSETDSIMTQQQQRRLNPILIRPKSILMTSSNSSNSLSHLSCPLPSPSPSLEVSKVAGGGREEEDKIALEAEKKAVRATKNMVEKVGKVKPVEFRPLSFGVEKSGGASTGNGNNRSKDVEKLGEEKKGKKEEEKEEGHGGGCSCSIM